MATTVGIDLGTTNTVVAVFDRARGRPRVLTLGQSTLLPSAVYLGSMGAQVGAVARRRQIIEPERTVVSVKRHMGDDSWVKEIDGARYSPKDVSSLILREARALAERVLGEPVNEAVITVPAYFTPRQYEETRRAGELAGLKVIDLLPEPTAAAIAYGFRAGKEQRLLVTDLGGGTFDVCVLDVERERFHPRVVDGDRQLGGDDFDDAVYRWLVDQVRNDLGIDLASLAHEDQLRAEVALRDSAHEARHNLTDGASADIVIPSVASGASLSTQINRETFERLAQPCLDRIELIVGRCLTDGGIGSDEIDRVILAGGATRMPVVRQLISSMLHEPYGDLNPDECVALGAAIVAAGTSLPIPMPVFTRILDNSLGVLVHGREVEPLLRRGQEYPASVMQRYTTDYDSQTQVRIEVFYGQERDPQESVYLGGFVLDGLTPAKRGEPDIQVSFALDEQKVLSVSAREDSSGRVQERRFERLEGSSWVPSASQSAPAAIVFVVDTTGSMYWCIDGVLDTCRAFADRLEERGVRAELGIIGFGDLFIHESPTIHAPTGDLEEFREHVRTLPRTGGGSAPESSLEAVRDGIELLKMAPQHQRVLILVTDAPPHDPGVGGLTGKDVLKLLKENDIITHVIGPDDVGIYSKMKKSTGGTFHTIQDYGRFVDIIDELGHEIADTLARRSADAAHVR